MYPTAWEDKDGTRHLHPQYQVTPALEGQAESMSKRSPCQQDTGRKMKSEGGGGTGREVAGEHDFCKGYSLYYDHSVFILPSPKAVFAQSLHSSKMPVFVSLAKNSNLKLLFLTILLNSSCSSVSTISCCLLYSSQFHRHGRMRCWHGETT